jgi:hypothetical protein
MCVHCFRLTELRLCTYHTSQKPKLHALPQYSYSLQVSCLVVRVSCLSHFANRYSDAEKFPPHDDYVATINTSANANARRRPGESDCALAVRIADEFLASWVAATGDHETTLFFYGDTPQGVHGAHGPWDSRALAAYGEKIVPQFGLYNAQASYPMDVFARWIRINKLAHQQHGLQGMVPWVTTGFDGPTTSSQTLAQAVHMLAGGCTGFAVFATAGDGDWDSWGDMLAFSKAVELVLPYEDVVAFGTVAYDEVITAPSSPTHGRAVATTLPTAIHSTAAGSRDSAESNVLAVSALSYKGRYLIALSAVNASSPMHVTVNVSSPSGYVQPDPLTGSPPPPPPTHTHTRTFLPRTLDLPSNPCLENLVILELPCCPCLYSRTRYNVMLASDAPYIERLQLRSRNMT